MINIFHEIEKERDRQDQQWGGPEHDDAHSIYDFVRFIRKFCLKIDNIFSVTNSEQNIRLVARKRFIKIAALAVAAIESIDRKQGEK